MLYLLYSPHACSSHRHDKYTQLFLVWCLFRAIAEFNDVHLFQLPTCHGEFDQRPFLVKTLQTCGPWIYVEPPKTRVGLDLEQMTVPAYEHIGSVGIEQAPDALGVAAGPTANVGHAEAKPLNFPMQGFGGFGTHPVVVNVAKHHPYVPTKLLHGIQNGQAAHIAGMPNFIAAAHVVSDAIVPMAVCVR